jgi:hypothetical protein
VLISQNRRFIFVHVQKTGGTSLEQVLRRASRDVAVWHGRHGHARAGWAELGQEGWQRYFSFAFVRNPWDRLVSWYAMIRQRIDALSPAERRRRQPFRTEIFNYVLHNSHDFESFLDNCTATIFDRGCDKSFLFNQLDYLSAPSGEMLVDFVGRYERFDEDAAQVLEWIGIDARLPRLNPSRHGHYRDYYTPRTRDLIAHRYARDIAHFGYEF